MTIRAIASLTGLALLPAFCPAFAQGARENVTEIAFDLNAVYDDNVARSSDVLAAQRGLENEDFSLAPTLSLNIARQIGTASVELRGQLGYVFYNKNSELDRERIGLTASADMPVGPCRFGPEASLQRRQSDLSEIVFLPTVGTGSVRNTETVQAYGARLSCGRSPGLQPFVAINYEHANNSAPERELAEYDATTYSAGLSYSSPALGVVDLYGSRRKTNLSPLSVGAGGDPGYRYDKVGVDFKRDIGSRVQLNASVGYGKLDSDNVLIDQFSGLVWSVDLSALVGANLRISAGTGRDVGNSLSSNAGFVVTTPHRVRLEYAFSDRARFELGGVITKRRFGYAIVPGPLAITNENQQRIDGALTYDLGRRFRVKLFGGHERRNANGTTLDYRANFAGASIGLRF